MFWDETSDNAALVPFLPLRIRLARLWSKLKDSFKALPDSPISPDSPVSKNSVKKPD
ncbi:hypothetical protein [Kiloniella sp.]|uniref:hypothetical protein n=1 Tax=Kiloniella sp. TaxID=1938587 RepID=UPI003A8CF2C6